MTESEVKVEPVANSVDIGSPEFSRFKRRQERQEKKKNHEAASALMLLNKGEDVGLARLFDESVGTGISVETQTDLTCEFIFAMESELQSLRTEIDDLKEQVETANSKYDQADFEGKNEKVLHYTGLQTFQILLTLFTYLEPFMPQKKSMTKFQMLILTIMRHRLNVSESFLSYEFGVSISTISRIFHEMIDVMNVRMTPLIMWPSRDALRKTMPMQFRKYFGTKCAVIIDCFEVFIDRPTNLKARAETWSSYKHHNTVKFLIGITPQGTVSYISKGWGGRTSDKDITENSGFLNNIFPGDLVLADRGFDIKDSVGSLMAEVKIPSFTKGRSQLAPADLETTRQIAHVRIHVERVIGTVLGIVVVKSSGRFGVLKYNIFCLLTHI